MFEIEFLRIIIFASSVLVFSTSHVHLLTVKDRRLG